MTLFAAPGCHAQQLACSCVIDMPAANPGCCVQTMVRMRTGHHTDLEQTASTCLQELLAGVGGDEVAVCSCGHRRHVRAKCINTRRRRCHRLDRGAVATREARRLHGTSGLQYLKLSAAHGDSTGARAAPHIY